MIRPSPPPDELFHNAISGMLLEWAESQRTSPHTIHIVGESWSGRAYELREVLGRCAHAALVLPRRLERRARPGRARPATTDDVPARRSSPTARSCATPRTPEMVRGLGLAGAPAEHRVRPRDRRRGPCRPVGGGLRRVGGLQHPGRRPGRHRRPGHVELADPQLPRVPSRRQRPAPRAERVRAGVGLRRALHVHAARHRPRNATTAGWPSTLSDSGRVTRRAPCCSRPAPPTGASGSPSWRRSTARACSTAAPASEAPGMAGRDVYVVGGANSAGQAALHLARYARARHARRAGGVARRRDVAVPRAPGGGDPEPRRPRRHRGRRRRRRRTPRAPRAAGPRERHARRPSTPTGCSS